MSKIKICGLSRPCDIDFINEARPDYCGFVINVPKSRRNVSPDQVRALCARLEGGIIPVGVFVDEPVEQVAALLQEGVIELAQLHGHEDESYLSALRARTSRPILQAFQITSAAAVARAVTSSADYILLDSGQGSGDAFDWSLVQAVPRPFFLAGGLGPSNLRQALEQVQPWAVDMSSGVETGGFKDLEKIKAAVAAVRR